MIYEAKPYHRKILSLANEDNSNNARVPRYPGKGYAECLARGWIEERTQPHAGYRYFAITDAGKAALAQPRPEKVRTTSILAARPPRLTPRRPRIAPTKR